MLEYDGGVDRIFNYSNKVLLLYELAFDYADGMTTHNLPLAAHWRQMQGRYQRVQGPAGLMSRSTHR